MGRSGAEGNGSVKLHRPVEGTREGIWVTHHDGSKNFLGWIEHTEQRVGANVPLEMYMFGGAVLSIVKLPLHATLPVLPLPAPPEVEGSSPPPAPSATEYSFHRSRP